MKRDLDGIKDVMAPNVVWYFLGRHKHAGVKKGLDEVLKFFDTMGGIMSKSKPTIEKLIVAEKDNYLIECQHIKTNREDGINIDHYASVLWTIENGKIIMGRHFLLTPNRLIGISTRSRFFSIECFNKTGCFVLLSCHASRLPS